MNAQLKEIRNLVTQMKYGVDAGIALTSEFDAEQLTETLEAAHELASDLSTPAEDLAKLEQLIELLQARLDRIECGLRARSARSRQAAVLK